MPKGRVGREIRVPNINTDELGSLHVKQAKYTHEGASIGYTSSGLNRAQQEEAQIWQKQRLRVSQLMEHRVRLSE